MTTVSQYINILSTAGRKQLIATMLNVALQSLKQLIIEGIYFFITTEIVPKKCNKRLSSEITTKRLESSYSS